MNPRRLREGVNNGRAQESQHMLGFLILFGSAVALGVVVVLHGIWAIASDAMNGLF